MKILLALLAAALVAAVLFQALPALSQTEFLVACDNGICQMRESDLDKLQAMIEALVRRLQDLQDKTGCS